MNKVQILAILALIGFSAFALTSLHNKESTSLRASTDNFCPKSEYRSDAWIKKLLADMWAINYDAQLMSFLEAQIPTDSHVFSTEQILSILDNINYDNSRLVAMRLMNPYILSLTSDNIVGIIDAFSFSSNKVQALKAIANTLSDVTAESKSKIIEAFAFSSDRATAKAILDDISPRNCIYGTITEKVAAFVIDISGSMDQTFSANGQTISRLQFVKAQLTKTIAEQLKPYQKFNVIIFGTYPSQWKSDYVDATPENVKAAIAYINGLKTNGTTDICAGLALAFNTKLNLNGIYLLSDGVPNTGIQTVDGIKKYLIDKNASRTEKVHINTISFIMGGTESQNDRNLSFQFLQAIADTTNGSFKGISG